MENTPNKFKQRIEEIAAKKASSAPMRAATTQGIFISARALGFAVLTVVILGGLYWGTTQYQSHLAQEKAKMAEEKRVADVAEQTKLAKESELQALLEKQQTEIENLKTQGEAAKQSQNALEKKIKTTQQSSTPGSISASEIQKYLTGVVKIECDGEMGSGSLWNFPDTGFSVLTNKHVVEKPYPKGHCIVSVDSAERSVKSGDFYTIGIYTVYPNSGVHSDRTNSGLDVVALKIEDIAVGNKMNTLNYGISSMSKCRTEMPIGTQVIILGYPAFTQKDVINVLGSVQTEAARTVSNGVISAYDTTVTGWLGTLPYANYYVSTKIDSGNSGGIAFAKDGNTLCVLGVPTWLSVGNYETQGLIQNIHNVFYHP